MKISLPQRRARRAPAPLRHRLVPLVVAIIALLMIGERPILAYIDPGTGSMIYQAVLTVVLTLGFVLRRTLASVLHSVRSRFGTRDAAPRHDSDSL